MQEIQKLIDDINSRATNVKDYEEMGIEEIGKRLRDAMKFEQDTLKKIEEYEETSKNHDLLKYARIISRNVAGQEIIQIQKIYLEKIREQYINGSR